MEGVIGKKALLSWASALTGRHMSKFEDLKDGVIILKLFARIWPAVDLRKHKIRLEPRVEWEYRNNWDAIDRFLHEFRAPVQLLDRNELQTGKFRACYSFLVMLFFLHNLAENQDFSVDFAYPIDQRLASFLQSTSSVECLARGGALKLHYTEPVTKEGTHPHNDSKAAARPSTTVTKSVLWRTNDDSRDSSDRPVNGSSSTVTSASSVIQEVPTAVLHKRDNALRPSSVPAHLTLADTISSSSSFTSHTSSVSPTESRSISTSVQSPQLSDRDLSDYMVPKASAQSNNDRATWRPEHDRIKGEQTLSELKRQADSYRRQLQLQQKESEFTKKTHQLQMEELTVTFQRELAMERSKWEAEMSQLTEHLDEQREQDRYSYEMALRRLEDTLILESDQTQSEPDPTANELTRLRHLCTIQSTRLKSLENSNSIQKQQIDALKKAKKPQAELSPDMSDLESQLAVTIQTLLKTDNVDCVREVVDMLDPYSAELKGLDQLLLATVNWLYHRSVQDQARSDLRIEHLKEQMEQQSASSSSNVSTERLQRLEEEVAHLSKLNKYLKARCNAFDAADAGSKDGSPSTQGELDQWLPTLPTAGFEDGRNTRTFELLQTVLHAAETGSTLSFDSASELSRLFWTIVSDTTALNARLKRSRQVLQDVYVQLNEQKAQHESRGLQMEQQRTQLIYQHQSELREARTAQKRSEAQMHVEIDLWSSRCAQIEKELHDAESKMEELLLKCNESDKKRFLQLHSKLVAVKEVNQKLQLRDRLWKDLALLLWSFIKDHSNAIHLEEIRTVEQSADGYFEELEAIGSLDTGISNESVEASNLVNELVEEVTSILQTRMNDLIQQSQDQRRSEESLRRDLQECKVTLESVRVSCQHESDRTQQLVNQLKSMEEQWGTHNDTVANRLSRESAEMRLVKNQNLLFQEKLAELEAKLSLESLAKSSAPSLKKASKPLGPARPSQPPQPSSAHTGMQSQPVDDLQASLVMNHKAVQRLVSHGRRVTVGTLSPASTAPTASLSDMHTSDIGPVNDTKLTTNTSGVPTIMSVANLSHHLNTIQTLPQPSITSPVTRTTPLSYVDSSPVLSTTASPAVISNATPAVPSAGTPTSSTSDRSSSPTLSSTAALKLQRPSLFGTGPRLSGQDFSVVSAPSPSALPISSPSTSPRTPQTAVVVGQPQPTGMQQEVAQDTRDASLSHKERTTSTDSDSVGLSVDSTMGNAKDEPAPSRRLSRTWNEVLNRDTQRMKSRIDQELQKFFNVKGATNQ
eukprot:GILJ01012357.1.p1 GENE.GILJ01012357.1~~GILJ01012357.1.p1  ORF type:complete len:1265 (-),score=242.07 GILJ01012357.1:142-3936(-)